VSRLSEQAARLDVDSYPVRFVYRTLFSDMVKATAGRPVPLSEDERERLGGLTFAGAEIGGRR
jgi:hypothetical protein